MKDTRNYNTLAKKVDNIIKIVERIRAYENSENDNVRIDKEKFNKHNDLVQYLENLDIEDLKIIRALMLNGKKILAKGFKVEDKKELFKEHYKRLGNDKLPLIAYIMSRTLKLDEYLKTGRKGLNLNCKEE
ncbi:MAG: hypothetical protein ACOCUI_05955 [bacterium]